MEMSGYTSFFSSWGFSKQEVEIEAFEDVDSRSLSGSLRDLGFFSSWGFSTREIEIEAFEDVDSRSSSGSLRDVGRSEIVLDGSLPFSDDLSSLGLFLMIRKERFLSSIFATCRR